MPASPSLATKRTHRVYLKHMLLSETAENLVPEWAFFVKCVVNANDLRPTASRESFYEDEKLAATRQALGNCLRDYLVKMARRSPERLRRLIALHHLSIKALATHGIQRGHMRLHARQIALAAGAADGQVQLIADQLVSEGNIRVERARELLSNMKDIDPQISQITQIFLKSA